MVDEFSFDFRWGVFKSSCDILAGKRRIFEWIAEIDDFVFVLVSLALDHDISGLDVPVV